MFNKAIKKPIGTFNSHSLDSENVRLGKDRYPILQKPTLTMREVLDITGWSRSTLFNRLRENFPKPLKTGPRTRVWLTDKVLAYLHSCDENGARQLTRPGVELDPL